MRPSRILAATAGLHRFVWDLHYPPPTGVPRTYPIAATPHDTASEPKGPWIVPGTYTARLTVDGKSYTQPLTVRMDPRVKSGAAALQQQFALSKRLYDAVVKVQQALTSAKDDRLSALSAQLMRIYGLVQDGSGPTPPQTVAAAEAVLKQVQ
jgi:hypothetical protein